jgi:predicted PurR-regulated permease PerM
MLVPGNLLLLYQGANPMRNMIILNASYYILISMVDNEIYKKNVRTANPYVTGMSFVMGVYTFGIKGIIYGPVILCVSLSVIEIIKTLIK